MDIEAFAALASRFVDEIPPPLCQGLSGGFLVVPEALWDGRYAILGQYIDDEAGSRVVFYYGSFVALFEGASREVWEAELRETAFHEIRHHVERLAGTDDLVAEETQELQREEQRYRRRRRIPGRRRLEGGEGR